MLKSINWRKNSKAIEKYQFIHHFIPNVETGRRATVISTKALFFYCAAIALLALTVRLAPKVAPGVLGYSSRIEIESLWRLTNEVREKNNLSPLKLNMKLTLAAEKKAENMFANDYWAHVAPDGTEPWIFIKDQGYVYLYAGENLAKNFASASDVVTAWTNSPSHRENLLSENYLEVGFAVVDGELEGYKTTLVVQMFGQPKNFNDLASNSEQEAVLARSKVTLASGDPTKNLNLMSAKTEEKFIDVFVGAKYILLFFTLGLSFFLTLEVFVNKLSKSANATYTISALTHILFLLMILISIYIWVKPGIIL